MPIHRVTDEQARWPRLGVLRKGATKPTNGNSPGRDLGSRLRFDAVDADVAAAWIEVFGSAGKDPETGQPLPGLVEQITVKLPYATFEQAWQAWYEEYVAGGLVRRCDGRSIVLEAEEAVEDESGEPITLYRDTPSPCIRDASRPCACKPVGRLELMVPQLQRMGVVTLTTTSIHDIKNIDGCLRALSLHLAASLGEVDLSRLPLLLKRVRRPISTPGPGGKRVRRQTWLLSLELAPAFISDLLGATAATPAELTAPKLAQLPAPVVDAGHRLVDGQTGELLEQAGDDGPAESDDSAQPEEPGWRERIDACSTLDDLAALHAAVGQISPTPYMENVWRLYWARAARIVERTASVATLEELARLERALTSIPTDTPELVQAAEAVANRRARLAETARDTRRAMQAQPALP